MKKKKIHVLKLLNHKNLQREVHMYGYHYSSKTHLMLIAGVLAGSIAIGLIFRLSAPFVLALTAASLLVLPLLILSMYQKMYEQKRFSEAGQYIEQMLYSFLKNQKIYVALKECISVFKEGQMHDVIEQAAAHIDRGMADTDAGVLREALAMIEEAYPCEKIKASDEFMLSVEERGGEFEESTDILLMDTNVWMRSCYGLQAQKKQQHIEVVLCILVSTILCGVVLYALNWAGSLFPQAGKFDVFSYYLIQFTSTVFIIFNLIVFYKSSKNLATDWLENRAGNDEKLILSGYHTVMSYEQRKERRKSLIYAAPFFIAAVPLYIFSKTILAVISLLLAVFLLFQHKIGYNLAKSTVEKELYVVFPQWLMDMALLLQNNNVYVSIQKSYENAPNLLKPELEALLKRIEEQPDEVTSYTGFFGKFGVQEIFSCMQMLYTVSETGNGDIKVQMENLMKRIFQMQENAEKLMQEHTKFKMEVLFSYPMAATCIKMAVDMTFGMVIMLAMLGNMQIGG